ncbi:hypothetical protein Pint_30255 [Pistacia integerrima]|uniref:Uncharacterized protein n=1 Tax=Pistacia integerrima TaxID=434235 RepID=A0ACC0X235_9ROSI|nr:hypothetical protein Pint_30255 [Pistacia integerrima]
MANHNRGDKICSFLNLLTLDPQPFPILLLVTVTIVLLFPQWIFFSEFNNVAKSTKPITHFALLAISILLVMLIRWLLSDDIPPPLLSTMHFDRCCWSFNCCFSEGFLPLKVGGLILVLLFMGQYQHAIHERWLIR